ncbi:MAG: NAD(P)H-dependent oxidoreductase subunit E, partial [bacterium]|nr:NAD(P)H-dependent oxidoreductase subunit E [bacterium]
MAIVRANVLICAGSACVSSRAYEFKESLLNALEEAGIREEVNVVDTGCVGTCDLGPVAIVYPDGVFYVRLKPEDAVTIVNEHLLKGRIVNRLLYQQPMTKEVFPSLSEIDFVAKQKRIVLRNMGIINPESIEEYIAREGYEALAKALTMTPEEVIDTVKRSGLRGRGGAGFPTGLKWELTRKAKGSPKYVICNGDEGDPGAFMDRSILEGDPHSVIEGMMIVGYAVGASKGFFYVR